VGRHWIGLYTSKLERVAFKRVSLLNEQPSKKQEKMVCGIGNVELGPHVGRTLVPGVGKGR